ncbi:MAG: hypothetical protein CMI55_01100 [Parcubacteria group bacterium]|nr:hypothetical protein [Parcubacteria group bacterium]
MPLPLGHSLISSSIFVTYKRGLSLRRDWKGMLLFMSAGLLPDIDFIMLPFTGFGTHRGFTHSFLFALVMPLIICLLLRIIYSELRIFSRLYLFLFLTISAHIICDFFTPDLLEERGGVMLFYPFSKYYFQSPLTLFVGIELRYLSTIFSLHTLFSIVIEALITGSVFLAVLYAFNRRKDVKSRREESVRIDDKGLGYKEHSFTRPYKEKLGNTLKNIGTAERVLSANLFKKEYPLSVTFISTYRCNFSCKYCDIWTYKEREMTTPQIFSMIDEFADMGLHRFSFNGGEPLLRQDIGELIDYCKSKGLFTTLFTNGWLVKERIAELAKLDVLTVTLDGPREIHDSQRESGSYDRVMDAIECARSRDMHVWTNTVITKGNLSSLGFVLTKAREMGFFTIFQPVLQYSHSTSQEEIEKISSGSSDYEKAIRKLKEEKIKGAPIVHSTSYFDYILKPDWSVNKRRCWAGKLYCAVKPNGEVAPCYPVFSDKKWPNGLEIGFSEAFSQTQIDTCDGCYCLQVESDFLFSLDLHSGLNLLRSLNAI